MTAPYCVVTLLELLRCNAGVFCRLSALIGQAVVLIETGHSVDFGQLAQITGQLQHEAGHLGLTSVNKQIERIVEYVERGTLDWQKIRSAFLELSNRLHDDLESRTFLAIPPELAASYEQNEPVFGAAVSTAFPLASEDISEAAKCLALGRSTAVVFHLMRAMEGAVQRLSAKLGVQKVDKVWGMLLSDSAKAIEAMPKGPERSRWSTIHTHLYHVKEAWRNDTMHPKQTYTFEEAKAIFEAVKVFLNALAPMV